MVAFRRLGACCKLKSDGADLGWRSVDRTIHNTGPIMKLLRTIRHLIEYLALRSLATGLHIIPIEAGSALGGKAFRFIGTRSRKNIQAKIAVKKGMAPSTNIVLATVVC